MFSDVKYVSSRNQSIGLHKRTSVYVCSVLAHITKMRLLASPCLSVRLSFLILQPLKRWTDFHEFWCFGILLIFVDSLSTFVTILQNLSHFCCFPRTFLHLHRISLTQYCENWRTSSLRTSRVTAGRASLTSIPYSGELGSTRFSSVHFRQY
jgi:hypothetical protein